MDCSEDVSFFDIALEATAAFIVLACGALLVVAAIVWLATKSKKWES